VHPSPTIELEEVRPRVKKQYVFLKIQQTKNFFFAFFVLKEKRISESMPLTLFEQFST